MRGFRWWYRRWKWKNKSFKFNHKDGIQYVIAAHLFNKSFMHLLIVQNTCLLNKAGIIQHFVFDQYKKMIFQGIIPDIDVTKVSTIGKVNLRLCNMRY